MLQVRRVEGAFVSHFGTFCKLRSSQSAWAGGDDEILLFAPLASTHFTEMLPEFLPQRPISAPTEMGSPAWMWMI